MSSPSSSHGAAFRTGCGVIGVLLLSLAASACGVVSTSGSSAKAGNKIKVGLLGTITGPVAVACFDANRGAQLAVSQAKSMNYFGGGVDPQLVSEDDQATEAGATTGYRALQSANALAFVGPCNSTAESALIPLIDKGGIPQVISYASAKAYVAPKLAFRGASPSPYYDDGDLMPLLKKRGVKTVFIAADLTNTADVNSVATVEKASKAQGIKIVGTYRVNGTDQIDFSSAVEQIKKLNPDAIGIYTGGAQPALMAKAFRAAGLKQRFFGGPTLYTSEYLGSQAVAGSLFTVAYTDKLTLPASVRFTQLYEKKFPGRVPTPISAGGYDAMWRVLRAVHDAGPSKVANASLTKARTLVAQALDAQNPFRGAQGPLHFSPDGDTSTPVITVQADGHGGVKVVNAPGS